MKRPRVYDKKGSKLMTPRKSEIAALAKGPATVNDYAKVSPLSKPTPATALFYDKSAKPDEMV